MNATETIISAVADAFDVTPAELRGPRGRRKVYEARHALHYLMNFRAQSANEVAKELGRCGSTVRYSVRKLESLVDACPDYCAKYKSAHAEFLKLKARNFKP